jgi:Asp-tRNA(Asn)/Glu-tRNA(Gln) amidotransferase A subunit family amidase
MASLNDLTVYELITGLGDRQFSVREVVSDCLRHSEAVEDAIQAWEWFDADTVIHTANALDDQQPNASRLQPLHGIPIGIKDTMATAGIPTRMGSAIFESHIPTQSATVVHKLERAGALIFGKTVTTEFAFLTPGKTRNPWNLEHTPGGSSSGSAAAVAAHCIPAALGTQTQGSVIRPAAYCGIVGYKPSYGLISRRGIHPLSPSLDHVGVFTRNVIDASLIASRLMGYDSHDPNILPPEAFTHLEPLEMNVMGAPLANLKPPKLALVYTSAWPLADADQQHQLAACAATFEQAGASIELITLPTAFDGFHDTLTQVMLPEVTQGLEALRSQHPDKLSDRLSAKIDDGRSISAVDYLAAITSRDIYRDYFNHLFTSYDAILTLSVPSTAPAGLENTGNPIFCELWSLTGLPAIALPSGLSDSKLPLSIQLVGGYLQDHHLLAVAQWCEPHLPNPGQPPCDTEQTTS